MFAKLKAWARGLKRDVLLLYLAARDPRVRWHAKLIAGLTAAYALSPIDLIPDFIPILGYLDDLLIVPAGIWLALRLIPSSLRAELREQAEALEERPPRSNWGAGIIIALWVFALAIAILLAWRWFAAR